VSNPSKADSIDTVDERRRNPIREAWMAAAAVTRWIPPPRAAAARGEDCARAMLLLPLTGLVMGIGLALADRLLGTVAPPLARSALTVGAAVALSGAIFPAGVAHTVAALFAGANADRFAKAARGLGAAAAVALLALEILALGTLNSAPARARALVLAMLLSRWAMVPIAYGLRPLEESGLGIPYRGGLTFTEFGFSSVIALGAAMGLYDVMGLAAIVAVALAILAMRLLLSRRLGGVGGHALAAGAAVSELITIAILAGIAAL
jgi:cobalamin synthase